jgi:hypothetical protein
VFRKVNVDVWKGWLGLIHADIPHLLSAQQIYLGLPLELLHLIHGLLVSMDKRKWRLGLTKGAIKVTGVHRA